MGLGVSSQSLVTGHLAAPLLAPRAEVLEVGVRPVRLLPGQHAQQAEEEHDAELEDVLDPVHLETAVITVVQNMLNRHFK